MAPGSKNDLRKHALAARALVSHDEAERAGTFFAREGLALARARLPAGAVVSAYWPMRAEAPTPPLIEALSRAGFVVALPVMHGAGKPLTFRVWRPGDALAQGPLGLSEPLADARTVEPVLLFTPLAAFDAALHRIGYGGGNFDATLALLRGKRQTLACGLAFDIQEVASVPVEPHDQRLDFVLTETRLLES